ncbi:MAG: hypothetical protein MUO78_09570 [candidate division Zixibacteria bacterium]|nr:hypothetical protein [candidate division Zixibacteria bacterium]
MAAQESVVTSAKAVSEGLWPNATMTPDVMAGAAKGMTDFAVTNLTPVPTPLPALAQAPLVTPVPIPPEIGAQAAAVLPDPALVFFLGGLLVILVLVIYEVYLWKKMKS